MEIKEYYKLEKKEQDKLRAEMGKCDWDAGQFLFSMLEKDEFFGFCGKKSETLLLVDDGRLAAFCTYAEHDEIYSDTMKPWIGFVYTFPEFRGRRASGMLCDYAAELAKKDGYESIYVSSEEKGLYEKYGFVFVADMMSQHEYMTQVFRRDLI